MNRRQTIPKELRYTVEQFHAQFPDSDSCLEFLKEKRFPGGVTHCAKCQQERKHYRVSGRTAYACDHCGNHIYPLAGTIFEKSTTSLRLWFYAMYLMGSTRCGISAKQIQRETGVTYKTAWRMFKQIRSLLSEPDMQLEGSTVEMDETYVGGRERGHFSRGRTGSKGKKTCVVGIAERNGGRVLARTAENASKATLTKIATEKILPKSTVFTDEWTGYVDLAKHGYEHRRVNHSAEIYVVGDVHTNTIEGFWMLLKTGIRGVYHSVGKNYLQTYLDEYAFRYNRRDRGNLIFAAILERVSERASSRPSAQVAQNQTV
jgi:transposase-like protein